ncbi:MAG TPA: universal stress protein [Flavobacteriales bacterium]
MNILCPTDFTPAADIALARATHLAAKGGASITLLHVLDRGEVKNGGLAEASARMDQSAQEAMRAVKVHEIFREGDTMKQIAAETSNGTYNIMVAGTHGVRGIRQSLLGADMLKLVRHVGIPSLVVQANTPPHATIQRIVMPVAGHDDIGGLLDDVCYLAGLDDAEVLIYQLDRPGEAPSDRLLENKRRMLARLTAKGIRHREVHEPSTVYSAGFAAATIAFAKKENADLIAIMAQASAEYSYIADADKERLLANDAGIPVLCAV